MESEGKGRRDLVDRDGGQRDRRRGVPGDRGRDPHSAVEDPAAADHPLGLTTAAIFLTSAVHHGHHAVHMALPFIGTQVETGSVLRAAWGWDMAVWDVLTASVGVAYWMQRKIHGPPMQGAQLFEDLKIKQRQALEINDNIVQGLTVAQMALELNQQTRSEEAIRTALHSARSITTELLGETATGLGAGDLRRSKAAEVR